MENNPIVTITMEDGGKIVAELYPDVAPQSVYNFISLIKKGFYNGLIFHRCIYGFMIQGGCPDGTGMGGPGYTFDDEIHPELVFDKPYQLAMANAGKRRDMTGKISGTNGSQFFITTMAPAWLNGKHSIFGEVADDASKAVVDAIAAVPVGAQDRPLDDVVMTGIEIAEV